MSRQTRALSYLRAAMLIIALALPLISLVLLGSLWLWQNGYVLYWAIAACVVTLSAYAIERWILRDAVKRAPPPEDPQDAADPLWNARENAAWDAVRHIIETLEPSELDSRDAVLALGTRTIDAVAKKMHPGEKEPLWKFTVPEALALIERVSAELGPLVRESIPLGDRLTVGQLMTIYRWRSIIGVAEFRLRLVAHRAPVEPRLRTHAGDARERHAAALRLGPRGAGAATRGGLRA